MPVMYFRLNFEAPCDYEIIKSITKSIYTSIFLLVDISSVSKNMNSITVRIFNRKKRIWNVQFCLILHYMDVRYPWLQVDFELSNPRRVAPFCSWFSEKVSRKCLFGQFNQEYSNLFSPKTQYSNQMKKYSNKIKKFFHIATKNFFI